MDEWDYAEVTEDVALLQLEIRDLQAEIARHHVDFKRISDIIHRTLDNPNPDIYVAAMMAGGALRDIREIVG